MAVCKKCGASIVWIKTPAGKWMPGDAEPVEYWLINMMTRQYVITPDGLMVYCAVGEPHPATVRRFEKKHLGYPQADGKGYIPHWATCTEVRNI